MKTYYLMFAVMASVVAVAVHPTEAGPATCVLEVAGKSYIDGACDHRLLDGGRSGFQVTGADGRHFVYVYVESESATAHWNGESAESRAHDPLGELRRDGACWINDGARICVSVATAVGGPPYGRWNCEIMSFSLDAENYAVSGAGGRVSGIEKIGDDAWGVELADGYRFALFDVTPNSLIWHSPASGDTFECKLQ
ncbi:MAG TPA: hypothetical protein PKY73_00320 [Hyphomonas sp.]|nr:hypothetical protein [Hyphomonas sp.]